MTDERLRVFVPDLVRWEGALRWMYRDSLGYVTVAIGYLLHDADEAAGLPFEVDGERLASRAEIVADFHRVIALAKGMPAAKYRAPDSPRVELSDGSVTWLTTGRLQSEFIPGLTRLFVGFEDLPAPAQSSLVDLAWNLGIRGLAQFGHLREAVAQRRWARPPGDRSPGPFASESCHVKTSREDRNQWRAAKFLEASAGAG